MFVQGVGHAALRVFFHRELGRERVPVPVVAVHQTRGGRTLCSSLSPLAAGNITHQVSVRGKRSDSALLARPHLRAPQLTPACHMTPQGTEGGSGEPRAGSRKVLHVLRGRRVEQAGLHLHPHHVLRPLPLQVLARGQLAHKVLCVGAVGGGWRRRHLWFCTTACCAPAILTSPFPL